MGTYVNPGTRNMEIDIDYDFYVDKSMLIKVLNDKLNKIDRFICVSRPRRFGKTMAANMIAAYYSKGCDSHGIFSSLKISKDPSFEDNINKYTVIQLDMNDVVTNKGPFSVSDYINKVVVAELRNEYPIVDLEDGITLSDSIKKINLLTRDKFVFIIDEYDVIIRDQEYSSEISGYLSFLVSLFKNSAVSPAIALSYLTGIMPIIREKVQSKLNNFTEYTMLDADDMAPFMGFTEEEVRSLAQKSGVSFDDLKRWYDGYSLKGQEIYSPKSVISAVTRKSCDDYWTQTSSYRALKDFILMDFEGIRKDIVSMISGSLVPVNVRKFTNTPWEIESRDDVFTCLIHLGYLGYDSEERSCFIPNYELMEEWISAIEDTSDYRSVVELIRDSKALMEATWKGDEEIVAEAVARAHTEACSILKYNNEGSFQSALHLAYYYAKSCYTIVNELPGGKGYADVAFIPYMPDVPAIIIELKKDDTVDAAISQIRERKYPEALEKYRDNLLLVAITYDSKTKEHRARIEKA
ncbi:MAG: AAA family ATPase [Candidatus Ornithospirochaeta sp.]|nr:AAA family ATPase [Sphaerochaetaceae bacterium]MDY5523019.1 AAA family ATPase [Candidatus Ornithospirochaeta sp.]